MIISRSKVPFSLTILIFSTYLSHFDKEDVQSGASSILAKNRFPLRNNRLQQQQLLHNQSLANVSSNDSGGGGSGGNPYLANTNLTSSMSTNKMSSMSGIGGVTAGNSSTVSQAAKNLGPIRGITNHTPFDQIINCSRTKFSAIFVNVCLPVYAKFLLGLFALLL